MPRLDTTASPNTALQRTRSAPLRSPLSFKPLGAGRLRVAVAVAVILGIVCCRSASPIQSGAEAAVREALSRFVVSLNNLDWETFQACFAADATLFNPEIPEVSKLDRIDGKTAVEASFRSVFVAARQQAAGPPYLHIVPKNVRVQMLAGTAVVTFEFDRDGGSFGRRTVVFRKESDGWRIIHVHASNVSRSPGA
jgi:ketosteroid isomerase-like protein